MQGSKSASPTVLVADIGPNCRWTLFLVLPGVWAGRWPLMVGLGWEPPRFPRAQAKRQSYHRRVNLSS